MKRIQIFLSGCMSAVLVVGFLMVPANGGQEGTFAFSARLSGIAKEHVSTGSPTLIEYSNTLLSVGGGWNGRDTYTAPRTGHYFFSIQFVRDAYSNQGTADDVYVFLQTRSNNQNFLRVNGWAGEGSGKRATGAVSTVLFLTQGTEVRTKAGSDSGVQRFIPDVHFSGFLID